MLREPASTGPTLAFRSRTSRVLTAGLAITFALTAQAQSQASAEPARITISIDAPSKALTSDGSTDFVVRVRNSGGAVATAERIVMATPSGLRSLDWTCSAHGGSRCAAASGSGPLDTSLSGMNANSTLDFAFHAVADAAPPAFIEVAAHANLAGDDRCESGESAPCRAFLRIPTGPNVQLEVGSSKKALAPGQSVQYSITARTSNPASSTGGTILRSPVPNGLINSRWTCSSSVGACAASSGSGPIEQVVGDFSRGDIQFQIDATVAADPPATIVQSAVAVPPYGGSCAGQGAEASYRSAPCSARKELSTTARILVSRSEGYRGTPDTISTQFVLENVGARADGSSIAAPVPANATGIVWTCAGQGAQCPQAAGSGPIAQTIAFWPASGKLIYDLTIVSPSATTRDLTPVMQVMPPQRASCGSTGTPPPCNAPQPLVLEHSGLRLQQQVDRLGAGPGELVGLVVALGTDASATAAHDVVLSIPLPQGIDAIVSWACVASSGSATSCPVRSGRGAIRQVFPVLSASSDLKYFVQARVGAMPPATVTARSSLTAPVAASLGCSDRDGTTLGCVATSKFSTVPVLALEQSILANIMSPGSPIDYVLDVFNLGAKTDAVRVRSLLPAGISNISWVCSGLGMDCPAGNGSGSVSSTLQQMPAGAGVRYQVAATVDDTTAASVSSVLTATPTSVGRCHKDATHDSSAAPCTDRSDSSYAPTLELSQAATEKQLLRGGVVNHSLTLKNHGASTNGAKLSLPLASGVESSSWTCAGFGGAVCPRESGSGAINETISTLPFSSSLTYSIQSELAEGAHTSIAIAASTTPSGSALCANGVCANTLALPVTEVPSAHLQLVIESSQAVARVGSIGTWTIDVRNLGSEISGPFFLADMRPANAVDVLSWACEGVECPAASGTGPIDQVIRSLSIHDPASSEESITPGRIVFTIEGRVQQSAGANVELAVVLQPSVGDTCAPVGCAASLVLPTSPLGGSFVRLGILSEDPYVEQGGLVQYAFSVFNEGSTPVSNLPVYTIEPAGFLSSSWTCENKEGLCPNLSGSGPLNEVIASLPPGRGIEFYIDAQTASSLPPTVDFEAGANPAPPTTCDPSDCVVTTSLPSRDQLVLSLDADTGIVQTDSTVQYTFSVTNGGGLESYAFAIYSEPAPDFVSTSWTCAGTGGVECVPSGTGPLEDIVSFFPAGASVTYTVSATVGSTLQPTIDYLIGVTFAGQGPRPAGTLNCLPLDCTVTSSVPSGTGGPARLSISKTANRSNLFAGGGVRYTVSFANTGETFASSLQLVDDIPEGLSAFYWSCSAAGDVSCLADSGSGPINEFFSFMAPGARVTYTVDADVADDARGVVTNLARLSGQDIVCEPLSCDANKALSVIVPTDLVVTKTASPASGTPVSTNQPIVWTLLATNDGGATTGTLTMADALPTGIRDIVVGVEAEVTCNPMQPSPGDTVICNIPAGFQGERHVTISAIVNAGSGTVISNTVRATAATGEVSCMDCTVSNPVEASFDIALMNPRPFSAGGIDGTLIDIVNLSEVPVSGASLIVTPASSLRLLSPFSGACTATVGDDGNVIVVCPDPPSTQGINCSGNTCSFGGLSQSMATTVFVALNENAAVTVSLAAVGDSNPSNNSIELPVGGTP